MAKHSSIASADERASFATWLEGHVDAVHADGLKRSRQAFLKSLGRDGASTGKIAAYTRGERLPVPEMLRSMAQFWGFNELEAFYRAGYVRELFLDVVRMVRFSRVADDEAADRARQLALRLLIVFYPLRGEVDVFAGLRRGDSENFATWLGHLTRDATTYADVQKVGGQWPLLLTRACSVLYEKSPASAALSSEARGFIAAEYVRAYALDEFGDDARRFVDSVYRKGVRRSHSR